MRFFSLFLATTLLSSPVFAQNREVVDRMDKLERDIMTVQKQLARRGMSLDLETTGGANGDASAASAEVRMSAIEDELRSLRGKLEENEFQMRKLTEGFNKFQQDVEFRFNERGTAPAAGSPATPSDVPPDAQPSDNSAPQIKDEPPPEPGETTAGDGILREPDKTLPKGEFDNPRDLYNHAFRLINQTRYEEAAKHFEIFTGKYPKDPLIGNAYYWLGETYYIRRDYVKAADNFRQGFEALPGGPKAADNLLKLSMALSAMKKQKEACVVLDQLLVKFKDSSTSVAKKADAERTRIGCR